MRKYGFPIIILIILAFVVYWFVVRKKEITLSDLSQEDRTALAEDSAIADNSQPQDTAVFPNTPLGNQLRDHMMVLALPAETVEEADARYNKSLTELKRYAAEATRILYDVYNRTEARHYFNRWGVVKTLGELGDLQATQYLSEIADSKLPPETSQDLHHFSTQEEEVIIRIRAIEGLGQLAKQDRNADMILYRIATDSTNKNTALRVRAIKAWLRSGKNTDERVKMLQSRLDKSLHEYITVTVTDPEVFAKNMEGIKKRSEENTNKGKGERPASATPSPKVKTN